MTFLVFLRCLWLYEEGESASSAFVVLVDCVWAKAGRRVGKRLSNSVVALPSLPSFSHNRVLCKSYSGCMVARFVALCRLSHRCSRPLSVTRSFATRRSASSAVKTKKKLSELPQAKLQADGTAAPPLEPFNGGLGIKKSTRRTSSTPF